MVGSAIHGIFLGKSVQGLFGEFLVQYCETKRNSKRQEVEMKILLKWNQCSATNCENFEQHYQIN